MTDLNARAAEAMGWVETVDGLWIDDVGNAMAYIPDEFTPSTRIDHAKLLLDECERRGIMWRIGAESGTNSHVFHFATVGGHKSCDEPIETAITAACCEALESVQPCGHPVSAVVSSDEGTNYCGECARAQI